MFHSIKNRNQSIGGAQQTPCYAMLMVSQYVLDTDSHVYIAIYCFYLLLFL